MNFAPLLDFIQGHEAPKGYDQIWSGIKRADYPAKPITKMTIREVLAWQDSIDPKYRSEAVGGFQVLEDTLRSNYLAAGLTLDSVFSPDNQKRFAVHLLRLRGLDRYLEGSMSLEAFCNSLAKEWASLPVVTDVIKHLAGGKVITIKKGHGYYDGDGINSAYVPVEPFLDVVRAIRGPAPRPDIGEAIAPLTDNHGGFWASFWFYVLLPLMALFGAKK